MRITEIDYDGPPPIDAYGGGGFRLAGTRREGSLLLLPDGAQEFAAASVAEITEQALSPAIAAKSRIDVLLIGVGPDIAPLPATARQALEAAEIGYEIMATPSACRTYNVLLAEGRRVAAALIAV